MLDPRILLSLNSFFFFFISALIYFWLDIRWFTADKRSWSNLWQNFQLRVDNLPPLTKSTDQIFWHKLWRWTQTFELVSWPWPSIMTVDCDCWPWLLAITIDPDGHLSTLIMTVDDDCRPWTSTLTNESDC